MRGDVRDGLAMGENPNGVLRADGTDFGWGHGSGLEHFLQALAEFPPLTQAEGVVWRDAFSAPLPHFISAQASDAPVAAPAAEGTVLYAATIDPTVNVTATPADGVGVSYGETFSLHSNPTSTLKIYLDFDGHTTTGTAWNTSQSSFYSPAFSLDSSESFSAEELLRIQSIWQRMAEYFAPFNIDVTTE
ncbi:hypothetical protein WDZ92_37760, partial [Nostoc sp. NIES-2111]